jgi:2Fe-2S ferredoxin
MKIFATDLDGALHELEGTHGGVLMELLRDNNLPIAAECGGSCICATCHVFVDAEWLARLVPSDANEKDLLDFLETSRGNSRLSCQIVLTDALHGLRLEVAPPDY